MTPPQKLLAICLSGVMVSLLLVGVVSSTFVRHVVQVVPIALVLAAIGQGQRLGPYFALAIFALWGLLMTLIWLYLLGIQTFFGGSFSPMEIALTILIGGFSAIGITAALRHDSVPTSRRIAAFGLFTIVQVAALWISFMPAFANR